MCIMIKPVPLAIQLISSFTYQQLQRKNRCVYHDKIFTRGDSNNLWLYIPTTPESSILKAPVFNPAPSLDGRESPKGRPTAEKCTGRKPRFPLFSFLCFRCLSEFTTAAKIT